MKFLVTGATGFAGPHTIDVESIAKSGQLIKAVV